MIGQKDGKALFLILFLLLKLVKQFLLSEEVFDFSRGEMTQSKIKELKQSLNSEFQLIHELCLYVLSTSQRTELIRATLSALHAFLSWIPLGYIFESPLLETLLNFFPMPSYRNLTLQCLTEVAALNFGDFYNAQYVKMYTIFMKLLQTMIPLNTNIPEGYAIGSCEELLFRIWLCSSLHFISLTFVCWKLLERT
ncbi:protein EXPORTIN 1B-like [Humulus lupulus]|uniref:protein EXPORTIN 1B-like n=1 Tax=Humulus lupulus TaxID=3486 RepID=UPI002B40AA7B|nr:protein EXPORTIN 1B-like [Humulus lupulus]